MLFGLSCLGERVTCQRCDPIKHFTGNMDALPIIHSIKSSLKISELILLQVTNLCIFGNMFVRGRQQLTIFFGYYWSIPTRCLFLVGPCKLRLAEG